MITVLRLLSVHVCFMGRNDRSYLIDSLKGKLNICMLIFSPFFCLSIHLLCSIQCCVSKMYKTYILSCKYTT